MPYALSYSLQRRRRRRLPSIYACFLHALSLCLMLHYALHLILTQDGVSQALLLACWDYLRSYIRCVKTLLSSYLCIGYAFQEKLSALLYCMREKHDEQHGKFLSYFYIVFVNAHINSTNNLHIWKLDFKFAPVKNLFLLSKSNILLAYET